MNPAWSVIFFTVLAGLGQGLFVMLVLAAWRGAQPIFLAWAGFASAALLCIGLACSFLHLGHPLRAWRAIAMWRTSWLSREVIVLPVTIAVVVCWSMVQWLGLAGTRALGIAGVLLCVLLWYCTGMIYACIRFLREWAHPLTLANFTLMGLMSGATLFAAYGHTMYGNGWSRRWLAFALGWTLLAVAVRLVSLARNHMLKPLSTVQSATGVKNRKLKQISQGATGGSFNTREFFHGRNALFLANVRMVALGFGFVLPALALAYSLVAPAAALLGGAVVAQFVGLLAERWLFFAQANHPQNIYYQAVA